VTVLKNFNHYLFLVLALLALIIVMQVNNDLTPEVNRIFLEVPNSGSEVGAVTVALLSDLHIEESESAFTVFRELWSEVLKESPDIILLAGDYSKSKRSVINMDAHRMNVARVLGQSNNIPVAAVLGNYENDSAPLMWSMVFRDEGIVVLNNEVWVRESIGICIRGLGDHFTGQFKYTAFPPECEALRKITLTHDPAGAFHPAMRGIVLAGHTHCGQVQLPVLGALFVPTEAPREAQCGHYKNDQITLFVSSGVGTSLLPLRFLAQSQWDIITFD
jgi:predicted MPP superfamily phosphohydrolase